MADQFKLADDFQTLGREGFDAAVRAYGEANKGLQEIATETSNYCKKAFEQATLTFEQLLGVKSLEQAIEIQSQYMKKGYDAHVAEVSKLGEMYVSLAQSLYKPFEKVVAKRAA
jgi:hypothetical protein